MYLTLYYARPFKHRYIRVIEGVFPGIMLSFHDVDICSSIQCDNAGSLQQIWWDYNNALIL